MESLTPDTNFLLFSYFIYVSIPICDILDYSLSILDDSIFSDVFLSSTVPLLLITKSLYSLL